MLFTSFEQYKSLPRVLDQIGAVFGTALEQSGVHWLALSDADRRSVALQVLKQIPVLWIWDNVEPVAGFPAGTASAWNTAEQKELKDFLSACRDTKAKVLLTSRRDEQAWLGDLAVRLHVPAMPMQERVQLARALAEKHNRRLTEVEDWRPLLQFTQGNPLTITVLVGQALRDLAQAEHWYRRSLELRSESDPLGCGKCHAHLGIVSYERFRAARATKQPKAELLSHLNAAVEFCHQALDLLPENAVDDLAVLHNMLGSIYGDVGDLDRALTHYRESIRYKEAADNTYGAGITRFNVAYDTTRTSPRP